MALAPKANPLRTKRFRFLALASAGAAAALVAADRFAAEASADETIAEAEAAPGPKVTVAAPVVKPIVEWDEYTGRFEAVDDVEIRARVSGYLTDVAFKDGDIVQAGDLLFKIDPRPFEAALAAAKADLASASAAFRNAKAENVRGERLLERNAISKEEADRRTRTLRQAEAAWAAAKAQVTAAELDLEFTEVRAPISGRISDNFVSNGNLIVGGAAGGTLLTSVVSTDPIYFEFTASEADYLKYTRLNAEGSRASSRDEANPVRLKLIDEDAFAHEGRMSFVDNQLDRSTGTMRGRATFDNPDGVFAPGMFGRLQLLGSGEYTAIMIPDSAVQTDQSEKFVWTASVENVAVRTPVELGPMVEGLRVVRDGLDPAARVIVSGAQFVQANAAVTPSEADDQRLAQLNLN
ncbi:MAG: efflux RND transporter periplasmic adaptor subunit [Parvularculaceae bacterium]